MNALGTFLADLVSGSFLQQAALWPLNNIPGFPPIIQTVHILGIAVVMATAVLLNLRALGLAMPSQSLSALTERVMPWFWWALASNVFSGAFFVLGRPNRYFSNPVFVWKVALLLPAVAIAMWLHHAQRRQLGFQDATSGRWVMRLTALVSLVLWLLVIFAGRWIAYLEYLQYPLWRFEVFDAGPQPTFWLAVENWPLSQVIAATNWFPLIETLHVIAVTLMVGSLLWVDLRLLGVAHRPQPISQLNRELLPWIWAAFGVATVTGLAMFITRASSHIDNPAFQWKLALLALAGINMALFHRLIARRIDTWDTDHWPPGSVRLFGASSLLIWSGVMLAGRWIGHIV